jgi:BlaI family transcriptional regulator, penicillinase repressor
MEVVGPLQIRVLHHLWAQGPSTVSDVHVVLNEYSRQSGGRQLAYTTILTVMRNLVRRKILSQTPIGRAHRFTPLVEKEAYQHAILKQTRADLFAGDTRALIASLVADEHVEDDLRERLKSVLA